MWNGPRLGGERCERAAAWLEEAATRHPHAGAHEDLLLGLPKDEMQHVQECPVCAQAVKDLLESRGLLQNLKVDEDKGNPFFAKRVLASIAAREAEIELATRTWAVIPRLASRLAGIAILVLLIAGTWIYEGPARKQANQPVMEPGAQLFEDNATVPADRDAVLVSLLERGE
jgi:hypothetical protein